MPVLDRPWNPAYPAGMEHENPSAGLRSGPIPDFLLWAVRVCLLIVAGSAAVFVARYQSDRPWLAGWSWKYLAAVVAPLAGLAVAILLVRAGWI